MRHDVEVKKADTEHQVVYGEVYVPNVPDSQGDWATADDIQQMAWDFLKEGRLSKIDTNHDLQVNGCLVVESFIARKGDPDFIEGAWVLGVHVPDADMWEKVKKQEINGFSLYGMATTYKEECEIEIPDTVWGTTSPDPEDGHTHRFQVKYDNAGNFLGGVCEVAENHSHVIVKGTVTEESAVSGAGSHRHRFSFIEGISNSNA